MVVYSYVRELMRFHHNPDTITTDNNVLVEMIFVYYILINQTRLGI